MLVKTLLIALVSFIGFLECGVGNSMIQRPIVMGPLVGLVLGDVNAGLAVGATLELAFMGNVTIGAALPPEITAGGILGTALAIVSGNGTEAALALALPIATVALLIKNTYYLTVRSWFLHKSDKYAAEGNAAGVDAMHMISFLSYDIVMSLVIAICFYCGSDAVQSFLAIIPAFIIRGISVAAGILPALGFAMLGKILISPKVAPYFLLGFLLAAYLNVPVLGIALLGVIIVALMLVNDQNKPNNTAVVDGGADDDFFTVNASFNYERQMSQGAQYALSPILQKLYPDKKELGEALQRHAEFFNTTPMLCPFIFGITAAMEEENATQEDFDPNTINSVKAGLMGPLAGIGDSVFWGTLRPLAGGIACSLALTGNLFAPFLFLLLFNIPNVLVRYFGCHWGYNSGMKALNRFEELGLTEKIFTAAAIIGLLVIGGMSASMVSINPVVAIGSGDNAIKLIDVINGIMPKMLSLLTTLGVYRLLKKGTKPNTILLGIIVVSVLLTAIGIF